MARTYDDPTAGIYATSLLTYAGADSLIVGTGTDPETADVAALEPSTAATESVTPRAAAVPEVQPR